MILPWVFLLGMLVVGLVSQAGAAGLPGAGGIPTPPPPPEVAPLIGLSYPGDRDQDRIDDRLAEKATSSRTAATPDQQAANRVRLEEMVEVELIFKEQITQQQIDGFLGLGGEITYIYKAVSFGWNGRIPLGMVAELPGKMGGSLVLVQKAIAVQTHLDTSTRTGRVRPIWAANFAGSVRGFDGDPNITIAIVDTGVDESHPDLNGRRVYWKDFTGDEADEPIDLNQHGSHVAGIALGSGTAGGAGAGTLLFTTVGDLTGVADGSGNNFSSIDLPPTAVDFTMSALWNGGGSTQLSLLTHPKGTDSGFALVGSSTGGSRLSLDRAIAALPPLGSDFEARSVVYAPVLSSNGAIADYVISSQVSGYPSAGDGFNKFRGVAPECMWAGAKVFTSSRSSNSMILSAGLDDLVFNRADKNIKVMNLSLGVPGADRSPSLRQKINTAVNNGIVVVVAAGNSGKGSVEINDPGRAALALTVGASNDVNQLTDYTSLGFSSPGSTSAQEEDFKPDLMAPGGSDYHTDILSVDSNSGDGPAFGDQQANDYRGSHGTSMATPFVAGAAALVIDAMQQQGVVWDFDSSEHSRFVKMLLCSTSSESNATRESNVNNPSLQRAAAGPDGFPAGKDRFEGFGMMNPDAAVEAVSLSYDPGSVEIITLGAGAADRRVWARSVTLVGGRPFVPTLLPLTFGDYDLYLYSATPSGFGTPALLASSTTAGGVSETINYTPADTTNALLVVKRISGSGPATLLAPNRYLASTSGKPLWNRPDANGALPPQSLSATGTATPYDVVPFTVDRSGSYSLKSTATGGWFNDLYLYRGSFRDGKPLENVRIGDTTFPFGGSAEFSVNLQAGETYYAVTTGFLDDQSGDYTLDITGAGASTFLDCQLEVEVANAMDSGPGSLRQALAEVCSGGLVTFASGLSGSTISLNGGQLVLDKNVDIDASALPDGITISGAGASRVFLVEENVESSLTNLTITGGTGVNGPPELVDRGGGIASRGMLTLIRCQVTSNSSLLGGGVYSALNASLNLRACVFSGNDANFGGGVYVLGGFLSAENSLFHGNYSTFQGGAISITQYSPSTLVHCTLTGNSSGDKGGGISGNFSVSLNSCIVYDNTAPDGPDYFGDCDFAYSCASPLPSGSNNIDEVPQFVNAGSGDFRLEVSSPCRDGSSGSSVGPTDLDGNPRIVHGKADMGAYENQVASIVWYVAASGDDANGGTSWATAKGTIQAAIDEALASDSVLVGDGTWGQDAGSRVVANHGLPNRVVIDKPITVRSQNGPSATTIEGFSPGNSIGPTAVRCVYLSANSTLIGFTLKGGATLAAQAPGGFFQSLGGGGAYCEAGAVLEHCIVEGNSGISPGGVLGGTLNQCLLRNNFATNWGGGVRSSILDNCILIGNQADLQGGGVYQATLSNCTLIDNLAGREGGGAYLASLNNCIIYDNRASVFQTENYDPNCTITYSCSSPGPPGEGNIAGPPQFLNPVIEDFRLRATSPCIDTGDNAKAFALSDFNGNPRVVNGTTDMGALESNGGYALWATAITNGLNGFDDSATGDGYPNLVKYATGSSATGRDQLAGTSVIRTDGVVQMFFNRDPEALDVTLHVEANGGLNADGWEIIATHRFGSWSSGANVIETVAGASQPSAVMVTDPKPAEERRFYRLRVTSP